MIINIPSYYWAGIEVIVVVGIWWWMFDYIFKKITNNAKSIFFTHSLVATLIIEYCERNNIDLEDFFDDIDKLASNTDKVEAILDKLVKERLRGVHRNAV